MRDRIDLLEEQVRQYREAAESTPAYPAEWGLTPKETRLVAALVRARGNVVSVPNLMVALYGLEPDADEKIIATFVCKIRAKLRAADAGITIRTQWGEGFFVEAPDADRLYRTVSGMRADGPDLTAELSDRVAALQRENTRLATELGAIIAQAEAEVARLKAELDAAGRAAAPAGPAPAEASSGQRVRRTWRELAASQAETRNRPAAGLRGGGPRAGQGEAPMSAEFDCCECGRHIVAIVATSVPTPPLCALCLTCPGWFRHPEVRAAIDPGHDGLEVWERIEPLGGADGRL
ncbi:helix-turn-helix domain-containing protein [Methylobacterium aquaticum]|uniref:helix-turn-helix domain-containing protein n=1 Tax=Methylobacterium aquaticum TaxID=270351 RepID=UPI0019333FBB|nr:helix-turn-helix domain-containing protein [Methylobacterium aquaticum]